MTASLRSILRGFRRSPAFVLIVVATLAIGIGLNAAIFTVVDCVILRPLSYRDADRLVGIQSHLLDLGRSTPRIGGDDYSDLSRQVKGLQTSAYYWSGLDGVEFGGNALYLPVAGVSSQFLEVMGVQPIAGRSFQPGSVGTGDALAGASFAREHFGSAQAALGKGVHADGVLHTIVGVLPDGFSFPDKTALWLNLGPVPDVSSRTAFNQYAIGKRRADVTPAQLTAELAAFSAHLRAAFPEDRHKAIEAISLQDQLVGNIGPTLHLLMGSVAVLLLIVFANIMHLQLVRATRELRAITIRSALGASRGALASRALLEAALLATAGFVGALLLATPALKLLIRLAPADLPRLGDIHLNGDVLLLSFLLSLLLMCLAAVLPVWRSWHVDPASALRQDASRGVESRGTLRLRSGLLVAEVALTLSLSIAAILLARQLMQQSRQDLGFAADNLITLDSHFVESTSPAPTLEAAGAADKSAAARNQQRLARLDAAMATVASVPGVTAVAAADSAPMGSGFVNVSYAVRGRQVFAPGVEHLPDADVVAVTPGFLATLHIPLLHGRGFTPTDRTDTPPVLLVSESLAREVFPDQNPIGQQIMCGYDTTTWWTIVGVTGDMRDRSPALPIRPTMYVPIAQHPGRATDMQLLVRSHVDPTAMVDTLRVRLKQTHPDVAVEGATMRANIAGSEQVDRFRTVLLASFAGVSILLAGVGLYSVTAYTVAQRRFEFGVRLALGATRGQMLGLVLRNTARITAIGIAIGAVLSLAASRILGSVVRLPPAFDVEAYTLAACAIVLLSLLAALLPAWAAATVDPVEVLRSE